MKRRMFLAAIVITSAGALYYTEHHTAEARSAPKEPLNVLPETPRVAKPMTPARLSDADEIDIGDSMAASYLAGRHGLAPNEVGLENYIAAVGRELAGHARRNLVYRFHYIPDATFVNAFALPGGHIFIGRGLLQLMHTEDELASVLGHEVAHIDNYDCNEMAASRPPPQGDAYAQAVQLFQTGYSKDQEMKADRDSVDLTVRAGYSPGGAIHLFQSLARLQQSKENKPAHPGQQLLPVTAQAIEGYLRSHPLSAEREEQIRGLVASENWPQERPLRMRPASPAPEPQEER